MIESLKIIIKQGSQGLYYTIDGKEDSIFDIHFPIVWAIRELTTEDFPSSTYPCDYPKNKKVTGAIYCSDCRLKGSFNGVIVSYCTECFTNLHSIGEKCGCLCLYNIRTLEDITNKMKRTTKSSSNVSPKKKKLEKKHTCLVGREHVRHALRLGAQVLGVEVI
jgi:hypothetical protein